MKMKQKKWMLLPCLLLSALLLLGSAPLAAPEMPPTYTNTDIDDAFPLRMAPVVEPDSVFYLPAPQQEAPAPSDDPDGGFGFGNAPDKRLDTTRLSSDLQVSVKQTAPVGAAYHITLSRDGVTVLDQDIGRDETLTVPDLAFNGVYDMTVTQTMPSLVVKYIGSVILSVDIDNMVFVNIKYQSLQMPGQLQMRNPTTASESESNDTMGSADMCNLGVTIKGTMRNAYDVDYFTYTIPSNSTNNGGQLSITLSTPNLSDGNGGLVNYGLQLICTREGVTYYTNTSTQIGASDDYLFVSGSFSGWTLKAGDKIYVKVYLADTNVSTTLISSNYYYLNVNCQHKFSWYSQHSGRSGSQVFWNSEKLDKLYFPQSTAYGNVKFISDITADHATTSRSDLMDRGCFIASTAMVLRNMQKTMNGTDFRTGFIGPLYADPFTVTLANVGKNGSEISQNPSTGNYNLPNVYVDPISVSLPTILPKFGATYRTGVDLTGTDAQKISQLALALSINQGKGIIVLLKNSSGSTHYIVIVGDNGGTSANQRFIVCDPGTVNPSLGDNVLFGNSKSVVSYNYTISHASRYWSIG